MTHRPTMYVGWLFVMQHHGLPTRLLDWSESSLVALYFAVEDTLNTSDAAVWVMHPWNLNRSPLSHGQQSVPFLNPEIDNDYRLTKDTVATAGKAIQVVKGLPMALRPAHTTRRIVAQRGQFTIHGHEKIGLDKLPTKPHDIGLVQLRIAGGSKLRILQDLYKAGISRFTLFPDLDGLAVELKTRYSKVFMK